MCRQASNVLGHIYLLFWQCLCSLPAVVMFRPETGIDDLANGLAYFIIVCIVAVYGTLMVCSRTCFDCCLEVRMLFNFFLVLYILAELFLAVWSGYFAYIFIKPLAGDWNDFYEKYTAEWIKQKPASLVPPNSSSLYTYYIVGAVASLLIIIFALFVIWSAIHVMTDNRRKAIEKRKSTLRHNDEEEEPLLDSSKNDDLEKQDSLDTVPKPAVAVAGQDSVPSGLEKIDPSTSDSMPSGLERMSSVKGDSLDTIPKPAMAEASQDSIPSGLEKIEPSTSESMPSGLEKM